jgi:hypothetical protein
MKQNGLGAPAAHGPRPRYSIGCLDGLAALLELIPQTAADAILALCG